MSYQPVRPNKRVRGRRMAAYSRRVSRTNPDAEMPSTWAAYLHAHAEWLRMMAYSETTVKAGHNALVDFVRWCALRSIDRPQQLTLKVLEQYQRSLFLYRKASGEPLSTGGQVQRLQTLKRFGRWLAREGYLPFNPASELSMPRMGQRLPRSILSVAEIGRMLAQADVMTPTGLRNRAIVEVLYSTGLRRSEMAGLSTHDVDHARRLVMVREGKGRRDRLVPIGKRALGWLDRYVLEAREELTTGGHQAMWVTDFGEPMDASYLAHIVKRMMESAGIRKTGSCHLLRHAMATHMLDNGADTRFIQAMLGHASLSSTQIYTMVSVEKLKQIHAVTHPARADGVMQEPEYEDDGEVADAVSLLAAIDAEAAEDASEESDER
ncbi:site-specific tyrosine recombinase XerC [Paraburkholderia sp. LEh10]|jgi:integrase/recombinase XerD|uniref:site-specific tyrosine recombinase XerC n=1 Tax=Paraburkholderia sp. LEh10 TaxID=2821353 RepID=UPI001AE8F2AA|nr:site-specific tyrosine recombinase XerC [Paraburkholderia sp. LEh10]MBP0595969.1 site-specific tyrosine recombinase XerC [Paraburkholderia sp. LEh10]MBP0595975.1 site-specific tyrosine recombinase XerC [Paraburkholderia sp. LEh10]